MENIFSKLCFGKSSEDLAVLRKFWKKNARLLFVEVSENLENIFSKDRHCLLDTRFCEYRRNKFVKYCVATGDMKSTELKFISDPN